MPCPCLYKADNVDGTLRVICISHYFIIMLALTKAVIFLLLILATSMNGMIKLAPC